MGRRGATGLLPSIWPGGAARVHYIVNTMGMSMGELSADGPAIATGWSVGYLDKLNVAMVQAIVSIGSQWQWLESDLGLGPIDTAMSVALPEFDGRLISVPVSFKEELGSGGLGGRLQRYLGKHGTLEWLPGKGVGLSASCYPEAALDDVPLFYPFIINALGEGSQAKRRAHATVVDHLIPAMTTADSYGDIARLEQLMDEHYQSQTLDPAKLPLLEAQIWELA